MYIEVEGVDALHDRLKANVPIVMPLVTQFYGMREFAITRIRMGTSLRFAERVNDCWINHIRGHRGHKG